VFEEIMPFIQSAVDGERVCILAYGQTGSGKTFTMEGPNLDQADTVTEDSGILPRAVDFIFKEIQRLELQGNHIELEMSCMEIYNDNMSDLLGPQEVAHEKPAAAENGQTCRKKNKEKEKEKDEEKKELTINFTGTKVIVNGLSWVPIHDNNQLFSLVKKASKSRMTDKTTWNEK